MLRQMLCHVLDHTVIVIPISSLELRHDNGIISCLIDLDVKISSSGAVAEMK